MDERLNSRTEDDVLTTRRTVAKGVAAGGLAALFAAVGAGRVLADHDGPDDDVDDGPDDDINDIPDDDDVDDDGPDDDPDDDDGPENDVGDGGSGGSGNGVVKGHHKNRRGHKGRH